MFQSELSYTIFFNLSIKSSNEHFFSIFDFELNLSSLLFFLASQGLKLVMEKFNLKKYQKAGSRAFLTLKLNIENNTILFDVKGA